MIVVGLAVHISDMAHHGPPAMDTVVLPLSTPVVDWVELWRNPAVAGIEAAIRHIALVWGYTVAAVVERNLHAVDFVGCCVFAYRHRANYLVPLPAGHRPMSAVRSFARSYPSPRAT